MLSHPVLLGIIWSLLVLSTSGQSQISNNESNKVYAYSYHFQHNGTTNSRDILRSVLGSDSEFGLDTPDGKSIVKTFSSPGIRGFFTKGVLPAGPISQTFNNRLNSPYSAIKQIVQSNLQPPQDVATGLLPPISPDISREFPGDFNNVNNLGNVFQNPDDFPKIPPPPIPPVIPNNIGNRKVENFARDTPDGGRVVGRVETYSYNPPPISNSISRTEENAEGYRRNENILNNNREVTGHRTQSFFRQQFRTVTPNLESNYNSQNNRVDNRNSGGNNQNSQWWNVLNVLGNKNSDINPPEPKLNEHINQNINEIQNNINRAFGARLSGFRRNSIENGFNNNDRQNNFGNQANNNYQNQNFNNQRINQNHNIPLQNPNFNNHLSNQNHNKPLQNQNFNNALGNQNFHNQAQNNRAIPNIPNIPFTRSHGGNNHQNINNNNDFQNIRHQGYNVNNPGNNLRHQAPNNGFNNNPNTNSQYDKDTEKKVMNLIHDVSSHLKDLHNNNRAVNNIGQTWDDDITSNINNDWSSRRRPFSNGHSGPSNGPQSVDILKSTLDALRNVEIPNNQGNSYRNIDGGGIEKFFGVDKIVEGPNSFSRNQQRGYERDFQVNSNSGYSRNNQWSSNTVRRLDAQSSKPDFSTDFIDVFRDD